MAEWAKIKEAANSFSLLLKSVLDEVRLWTRIQIVPRCHRTYRKSINLLNLLSPSAHAGRGSLSRIVCPSTLKSWSNLGTSLGRFFFEEDPFGHNRLRRCESNCISVLYHSVQCIYYGTALQSSIYMNRPNVSCLKMGRAWSEHLYIKHRMQDKIRGVYYEVGAGHWPREF